MASLETEGKSIEEAIEAACRQLNVPREKLEIEVLSAGSTGIFGIMGSKKARFKGLLLEEKMGRLWRKNPAPCRSWNREKRLTWPGRWRLSPGKSWN